MKKFLAAILVLMMLTMSFVACDVSDDSSDGDDLKNTESSEKNDKGGNKDKENTDNKENTENTDEKKYEDAVALISQGKYSKAYEALLAISDYEPAKESLKNFFYAPQKVEEKWKYADDADYSKDSITYEYDANGNIIETSDGYIYTYDENGNVLSGRDLIYGTYYNYKYSDGKLVQRTSSSSVEKYYYNSKGLISKVVSESEWGNYEGVYEYTYYENGSVKTMYDGSYMKYHYDEAGNPTLAYNDYLRDEADMIIKITYGEFGVSSMEMSLEESEVYKYSYTYDSKGKLTKLEAKGYFEGSWDSTHEMTFSNYQIYYSENPSVQKRVAIVCYTDIDAAVDIFL